MHRMALLGTALRRAAWHGAVRCRAAPHCTAPHHIAPHHTAWHGTARHTCTQAMALMRQQSPSLLVRTARKHSASGVLSTTARAIVNRHACLRASLRASVHAHVREFVFARVDTSIWGCASARVLCMCACVGRSVGPSVRPFVHECMRVPVRLSARASICASIRSVRLYASRN